MNGKVEAEAVPFYRYQLPLPRKFAASTASAASFRLHIPPVHNTAFDSIVFFFFYEYNTLRLYFSTVRSAVTVLK